MELALAMPQYNFKKLLLWVVASITISFYVFTPAIGFADAIGSFLSEKLIDRSGVTSSSLLIERTGVSNPSLDIGMSPLVSTQGATNINKDGDTQATLHGNLSSLSGFPSAVIYFEWGYDTNYGNTAGTQTVTSAGGYSTVITDFTGDVAVHYRFVGELDGVTYGSDQTLSAPKTTPGFTVLSLLPLGFAVFGIILIFMFRGNFVYMMITGIITVVGTITLIQLIGTLI